MEQNKNRKMDINQKGQAGKWKYNIFLHLGLAIALVAVLVFISYWCFHIITGHGKELETPDFTFMTVEDATKVAAHEHLNLVVLDSLYIHSLPRGVVYQQDPVAGSHVKKGRTIRVVINSVLPKKVEVPDLVGYSLRQAKGVLEARGLSLGRLIYKRDIATNNVLDQQYRGNHIEAGSKVESESSIDLVLGLSADDNLTYIPDVTGLNRKAAMDEIYVNSLNIGNVLYDSSVKTFADSVNAKVYRQAPSHSEFPVGVGGRVSIYLRLEKEASDVSIENK